MCWQTADARVVATRTQFRVTLLPGSVPGCSGPAGNEAATGSINGRGWSSPNGEPYRPLGKPDLSLKFTPRLADGSSLLQNAQRMRVFEGNHQHQPGGAAGSGSAKEKEVRDATGTGDKDASAQHSKPALFDLFPFNISNNRKRVLDERQVKFAYRLHESMASYSPEKIRSLQRRAAPPSPPRFSSDSSDHTPSPNPNSFQMLKEALHDCSSRLRLVRNGACFLQQLPPDDIPTLHELQHIYYEERTKPIENRAVASGASRLGSVRSLNSSAIPTATITVNEPTQPSNTVGSKTYLPYTTRHAQHSPHRHLPSLDEVRVKIREEKLQMPVRPLRSTSYDISGQMTARRPSGRPSRLGSTIPMGVRSSVMGGQSEPGAETRPVRPSIMGNDSHGSSPHTRHPSNIAAAVLTTAPARQSSDEKTPTMTQKKSPPKLHNIEKLQSAVSSIDEVKLKRSADLAQSIELLNQDRRECLSLKFKSFSVEHHIDDDMSAMRKRSEIQRLQQFELIVEQAHWYDELLRKLLSREGTGVPLHPAEIFVVNAIRQLTHEGREFDSSMFFHVILCIHREDLVATVVQDLILHLRDILGIHQDDWAAFFLHHELNVPVEPNERKEADPEPRMHRLNSKLRAVMKASQLFRHQSVKE